METKSSGNDVEKATKINPTVVFPKPAMSATLTELSIVESLALSRISNETRRIAVLPNGPNSSNRGLQPPLDLNFYYFTL